MSIAAGTRLGPYQIGEQLGAGGMGEVYRARDMRLDRSVAIKVVPKHLSDIAELRERFEREARAISSLNHPNICTLHDIGRQDGVSVSKDGALNAGVRRKLFQAAPTGVTSDRNTWDVTPDGQRFLINSTSPRDETAVIPITIILHWRSGNSQSD
jgi:serine/threonine protein kinase